MLSFSAYPQPLFEPTITNLPPTTTSSTLMTPSEASPSPEPSPSTPSSLITLQAQGALPDQDKFSIEERDFLRSQLPAYRAQCAKLDGLGSGPRKLGGVKGNKQEWVYLHIYPEFSCKFSPGTNTQTLKQVCPCVLYCIRTV